MRKKLIRNEEIVKMFKEGYRATAIAKKFGISRQRVYIIVNGGKEKCIN